MSCLTTQSDLLWIYSTNSNSKQHFIDPLHLNLWEHVSLSFILSCWRFVHEMLLCNQVYIFWSKFAVFLHCQTYIILQVNFEFARFFDNIVTRCLSLNGNNYSTKTQNLVNQYVYVVSSSINVVLFRWSSFTKDCYLLPGEVKL